MALILFVVDGLIIAVLLAALCSAIFGDTPIARLLRLLIAVAGGIGYFFLCGTINVSATISMGLAGVIFFAPIALVILAWILNYMFK